jgi:hypothetical protein
LVHQILEAWLAEDDKIRKANKLPVDSVERLKKDMLHWAQAAQGKDLHICNISRLVTSLTVCREVMTRCIPHWLVRTCLHVTTHDWLVRTCLHVTTHDWLVRTCLNVTIYDAHQWTSLNITQHDWLVRTSLSITHHTPPVAQ